MAVNWCIYVYRILFIFTFSSIYSYSFHIFVCFVFILLSRIFILEKEIRFHWIGFLPSLLAIGLLFPYYLESEEGKIQILNTIQVSEYGSILSGLNLGIKLSILLSVGIFLIREWIPNVMLSIFFTKKAIYSLVFILLVWIDLFIGSIGFSLQIPFFRKLSAYLLPILMYFYYFTRELWEPFVSDVRDNIQKNKYEKSKLVSVPLETIDQKLYELMIEKVYCDEDLNLSKLADMVGVKSGQLSEYFHKRYGFGFYHYINQYRIEEAKRYLLEPTERTILSIADAVGFNSKSTFNRVFLEKVGITPTDFRKQSKLS